MRDLLKSALRLRPDRIVLGEVRSGEALDLIVAMQTGHDGSMGTLHANNPDSALLRLETMCLMGESKIPVDAIRRMVVEALDIVVHCNRLSDGSRKVTHITEVAGLDKTGQYITKDIFKFVQTDKDFESGKIQGEMVATGHIPSFFDQFIVNKLPFPKQKFSPPSWYLNNLSENKKAS